jgi:hypothetical protein
LNWENLKLNARASNDLLSDVKTQSEAQSINHFITPPQKKNPTT